MLPALLTVRQAADRLRVPQSTVAALLRAGKLPGVKVDRAWRIDPADLAAFREANKVRAERSRPED
jgi:excisionase family DNA binding protein